MTSAYSIRQAFNLLYPGARGSSATAISSMMHLDSDLDRALTVSNGINDQLEARNLPAIDTPNEQLDAVMLRNANSIWAEEEYEWSQDYLDLIKLHLDASIYAVDYRNDPEAARLTINEWVEEESLERTHES